MQISNLGLGLTMQRPLGAGGGVAPGVPMTVAQAPTFTHDGATLTFGASGAGARVGKTLNEPWIINDSGFTITSDSPSAANDVNGFAQNGMMLSPYGGTTPQSTGTLPQGFDGLIGSQAVLTKAGVPYDTALNVSPTKTGGATLTIAPGWQGVIVKQIRRAGAVNGTYEVSEKYVYFNVVTSVPDEYSYPLAPSDPTPAIYGKSTTANRNIFRNLSPYTGMVDSATCLTKFPRGMPAMGWGGEVLRRMHVLAGYSGYSAQYGPDLSDARLLLHSNVSDANTDELFDRCVMHGIHIYGAYKAGYRGLAGAGQGFNEVDDIYIAAFALGNQAMLDAANAMKSNITSQFEYITSGYIGQSVLFPASAGGGYRFRAPYQNAHLGIPEWQPHDAGIIARYRSVCSPASLPGTMSVSLLQNGPSGATGEQSLIAGGYTSALEYMDRLINYTDLPLGARHRQMYTDWRSTVALPQWVGPPDIFDLPGTWVTAAAGSLNYNFSTPNYSIGAVTRVDIRYSLDAVGWTVVNNTGISGSILGLMRGVKYYVSVRFWNAQGAGPWSYNWPAEVTPGQVAGSWLLERNIGTPTGTAANAAPVNITPPALYYKPYPKFLGPLYEPAAGVSSLRELFAWKGDWSGYPAPTFTFQYKRNGANITAETAFNYLLWGYDAGQSITCDVTATNSSGSVTITSDAVVPAAATGTQAYYVPSGVNNALPQKFTERWAGTPTITLLKKTVAGVPVAQLSSNGTAANRFWSLDDVLPIGGLSNVSEGELYLESISGTNVAATRIGFGIRMSGNETTGNGYVVEAITAASVLQLRVNRVVSGVSTQASNLMQNYNVTPGFETGYSQAANNLGFRVRWVLSGANLVISLKAWSMRDLDIETGLDIDNEPVAFQSIYTDTSPIASGSIGISVTATAATKDIFGIGVGVGAGVAAPKVPV